MSMRPPFNKEAEQAVLSSLLYSASQTYPEVRPVLSDSCFYDPKHRWLYRVICAVAERGEYCDYVTVVDELNRRGWLERVGGDEYISELARVPSEAFSVGQYARRVRDAATRRQMLAAADEVVVAAHNTTIDVDDALAMSEEAILSVRRTDGKAVTTQDLMTRLQERVTEWKSNPLKEGETRGLATGIGPLDRALGGLEPGLYLVAARPSMGKTGLVSQCATNIAQRGQRVVFFTLEMSAEQIGMKMACSLARVDYDCMKRGKVNDDEYERVLEWLHRMSEWPLTLHHGEFRAEDVRAIVQREQLRDEVAAVFLDGLWLMPASRDLQNRNLELGNISRGLLLAARALGVPIVAVHQLSRAVERRHDKRPLLSDLRESGRLEEDADVVLMLYREGYYRPNPLEADVAEIWVRKNRLGGPAGRCVKLFWVGKYTRFEELKKGYGNT